MTKTIRTASVVTLGCKLNQAESFRIQWREDAPGTWLYHCQVEDHMAHGMIGIYRVSR